MNKTQVWKHASEVYAEVSELSAKQAIAYIYGIKSIDADVREAVITLINAGSQATQYFQNNITPHFNIAINNTQNFQTGQKLDEYELLEELGHGGMSQVFKAKRINTDQQTLVAIKIFAPRDNASELFNHFINEQKILSGLSHPYIVKMLHGGMTDDKTAYLVMELIEEAQPLDEYCQNNKLNTNKKMRLIAQCANALSYSHANLIIHRDLKPDNILVNKNKQLKIVDFGIAKLISNDILGNKTTIMALTPNYAAPEQINSGHISVKTDIFSLAVVALDLLTKESPLPKDRLIKSCVNDEAHIDIVFKKLNCDKDLINILQKALAQNPDNRYSSMQSFADDLDNYLNNRPVNATSQSLLYRIRKFAKRRSALFATMVSFLAFLIIGSSVGYQQYKQIKIEAEKANQVKQFLLESFRQTNPNNTKGVKISAQDLLLILSKKLNNEDTLDLEIRFDLLQTLGIAYGALGEPIKAIDNIKKSLDLMPNDSQSTSYLAEFLMGAEKSKRLNSLLSKVEIEKFQSSIDKARIYRVIAERHLKNSEFDQAFIALNKVISLNVNPVDPILQIISIRLEARILTQQSKIQEAIILIEKLISNKMLGSNNTIILGARSDLADMYDNIGKFDQAIDEWNKIIKAQRSILGGKHPDLAASLNGLSTAYKHMGAIEEAYLAIDEAESISHDVFSINNIITADILNSKAMLLYSDGKIDEAISLTFKVIKIYENQQSINYQETNVLKTNLALLLKNNDRINEAYELAKQVYDYQLKHLGETHLDTLYTQQVLARILINLDRPDEAITLAKLVVKNIQIEIDNGTNSSLYAGAYYTLAKIYQSQAQNKLAIDNFRQIIDRKLLNENEINYAILIFSVAKIYEETNDFDNAEKYYLEAIVKHEKIFGDNHNKTLLIQIKYAGYLKTQQKSTLAHELIKKIDRKITDNSITDKNVLKLYSELINN